MQYFLEGNKSLLPCETSSHRSSRGSERDRALPLRLLVVILPRHELTKPRDWKKRFDSFDFSAIRKLLANVECDSRKVREVALPN